MTKFAKGGYIPRQPQDPCDRIPFILDSGYVPALYVKLYGRELIERINAGGCNHVFTGDSPQCLICGVDEAWDE